MIILEYIKTHLRNNNYNEHIIDELSDKVKLSPEIVRSILKHNNLIPVDVNLSPDLNNIIDDRSDYQKYIDRVKYLDGLPKLKQKSIGWLEKRKTLISATGTACILYLDDYKKPFEFLLDKCDKGKPFSGNFHTYRGNKYENAMCMIHSYLNNVKTEEYSIIEHDKHKFIGASPDGICSKFNLDGTKYNKKIGTMVEIKCPMKIKDEVPIHYWCQVQTQLEVCDLDKCDFIQGEIKEYKNFIEFFNDRDEDRFWISKEHKNFRGIIIQVMTKEQMKDKDGYISSKHVYPPKLNMTYNDYAEWIIENRGKSHMIDGEEHYFDKFLYWKIEKYKLISVKRDKVWFEKSLPIFEQFWDYVLFYRQNKELLDEVIEYSPNKKQKPIFELIHRQYSEKNKKWAKPLYSDEKEEKVEKSVDNIPEPEPESKVKLMAKNYFTNFKK